YCEGKKSKEALRDCFGEKVSNEIKHSVTLEENLREIDLPVGRYKVLTSFNINKEGKADKIKVSLRGKHVNHVLSTTRAKLEEKVKEVLLGLPKMESGKLDGKPINTPIMLPIIFVIQ
ncbi:MAG: hypothetical protein HRT68_01330, partial [Flavobacteriaceae bacterium]|nr:hypothetical protein [Flavobacteriaceae bacterium]